MKRAEGLDDPQIAAIAWARFRRIMGWMALIGAGCVLAALGWLASRGSPMPIHMIIATTLGVWLTFMLGTGLMALVFLSSGTGHDEQVEDRLKGEIDIDG
ncbi:MAG: hypothetical protein ACO1NM_02710 [Sphingobium phenoxybenzoativorans]|uniref:hypothetical protein n=1 Tax=Sphingobium phenoxybenzoativorans TaxID=1592790 RepID=UPI0008727713|nr:hypothetical protein [Sphingobium phenoxybenzoativorans]